MGEAIISRSGGGSSGDDNIIVIPTHHSILVTIKGNGNKGLVVNYPVSCKDGSVYYNYTTNTKGQVLFMCNSGSANILTANMVNGIHYIDTSNKWTNIAAPVGSKTELEIELNKGPASVMTTSQYKFTTTIARNLNVILVGGGGGGGGGQSYDDYYYAGGGGGAGYMNYYTGTNIIESGNIYNFNPGSRGAGVDGSTYTGGTGGTSYIVNTNMSAAGGRGGGPSYRNGPSGNKGIGGLGNGGAGGWARRPQNTAENSPVSFAGGGGGSMGYAGGSPYGGTPPYDKIGGNATGMGGGGAGSGTGPGSSDYLVSGWGYSGGMVINITY